MLADIPYARLVQDVRLASEDLQREHRGQWVQSAFIGYQLAGSMGAKVGSFDKYLRKLGIKDEKQKVTREQVAREKATAFEALELVERMFDGGET